MTRLSRLFRALTAYKKVVFLQKFLSNPRQVGSITPSSQQLTRQMMAPIDWSRIRHVIELGAGTGVFTKAIARRIAPGCQVAVFEKDDDMRRALQEIHTEFHFFNDALKLSRNMRSLGWKHADCMISGLPFANFSPDMRETIVSQIKGCLHEGGMFVCFQYSLQMKSLLRQHFRQVRIGFVAWNAPPAFVYVCSDPIKT